MRIRFGAGLPGPFVLTSGRPRRSTSWFGPALVISLVILGLCFIHPWLGFVVGMILIGPFANDLRQRRAIERHQRHG